MSRSEYQANLELATTARTTTTTARVNIASGNRRAVVAKPAARGFFARVFGK
jgi:hypothetical protein